MVWLLSQDHAASPALKQALSRYASAWDNPTDVAGIRKAARAVRGLCRAAGF
jgi:hypothetical protein